MSSIYQKGRDGYYYYQTYIFNVDSGKKDKRIFHSLGTKDRLEAVSKQLYYDDKYKNLSELPVFNIKRKSYKVYRVVFVFFSMLLIFVVLKYFPSNLNTKNQFPKKALIENQKTLNNKLKNEISKIVPTEEDFSESRIALELTENEDTKSNKVEMSFLAPEFEVQRIDQLPGVFEQAKIFITVKNHYPEKILKNICEKVKMRYKQYTNIIICIYNSSEDGLAIAKGVKNRVYDDKSKIWLAMYSFNPVEGEYFDSNPGSYMGSQ